MPRGPWRSGKVSKRIWGVMDVLDIECLIITFKHTDKIVNMLLPRVNIKKKHFWQLRSESVSYKHLRSPETTPALVCPLPPVKTTSPPLVFYVLLV